MLSILKVSKKTFNFPILRKRFLTTYYTATHEWLKIGDNHKTATIGITEYAQNSMGDIVYADIEPINTSLNIGDVLGTIESVKASIDIIMPISGDIININPEIIDNVSILNNSPLDKGWLININIKDPDEIKELLSEKEYNQICEDEA